MPIDRSSSYALLCEYTQSESLRKHGLSVEAAMRYYAKKFGEDVEMWGMTGLLHDFDYEKYPTPTPDGHPYIGCAMLKEQGYSDEIIEAIMGHAHYTGVERKTLLAKTLFACDELCGLVFASVLVRPDRSIAALEVSSVKKKFKDKAFAKGVNRQDVIDGAEALGIPLEEHIGNVILALRETPQLFE